MKNQIDDESPRPLSGMLSQLVVAYTIELDNEFELRMSKVGFRGARLSLVLWTNLLRFVPETGISVHVLEAEYLGTFSSLKVQLGCLERWGVIKIDTGTALAIGQGAGGSSSQKLRRRGWGTGQAINKDAKIFLTKMGQEAAAIWLPPWIGIDDRCKKRFGAELISLYLSLQKITNRSKVELPFGVPPSLDADVSDPYPPKSEREQNHPPLSVILSQALLMIALEFKRRSKTSLDLCANIIQVLGENPVPLGNLPRQTGGSAQSSDIGWRARPYVILENDPSGIWEKVVRLSPLGLQAQEAYSQITREIENDWEREFGTAEIHTLRSSLEKILDMKEGSQSVLARGLVPPPGVARSGAEALTLGRRDVGAAARQRMRDVVEQTQRLVNSPDESLPQFPMWDVNRGFGP